MNQLQTDILNCLEQVKGTGKFVSIQSTDFVFPGLMIDKVNEVSFPLSELQAQDLIQTAHKAPFGKGRETILDDKVRSAWEIDAGRISLNNPKWDTLLNNVIDRIKHDLGLEDCVIEANLYKLLIYEEGDFFLPHKDTEKEKGMFGSLIINLPSKFTGGELVVSFDGEQIIADFSSEMNDHSLQIAAFYADCDHEVKPLTSGHRICLAYNLIQKSTGAKIEIQSFHKQVSELVDIFIKHTVNKPHIILLGHQYTPENFSYENLKLNDRYKAEVLLKVAHRMGCYAKMCLVTSFLEGSPEYDDWGYDGYNSNEDDCTDMGEVHDERLAIEYWLESDLPKLDQLEFEEIDLITSFRLKDDEPIIKESTGYMGNYGPDVMHWYHYGAVVIWTSEQNAQLLPNQSIEIILEWINYFNLTGAASNFEVDCINHFISNNLSNSRLGNKANYNAIIDWLIQQQNTTLLLRIDLHQLQLLLNRIETYYWQKILEFLPINSSQELLVRFTQDVKKITIEKLLGIICSMKMNSKTNHLALEQTMMLPYYFEKLKSLDLSSFALVDLMKIETEIDFSNAVELSTENNPIKHNKNQWIDRIYNAIVKALKWEYIHDIFSPKLLEYKNPSVLKDKFLHFCQTYLEERVNSKPQPPVDWKRSTPDQPKDKAMWSMLQNFMDSAVEEMFDFKKPQTDRARMENAILSEKVDLKTETIKKGSPHILRIIKTQKNYENQLSNWNKDVILLNRINKNMGI